MNTLARAFSLLELLVVVAIVVILATAGGTAYRSYVVQQTRSDAYNLLFANQTSLERFYAAYGRYPKTTAEFTQAVSTSTLGRYNATFSFDASNGTSFTIRATLNAASQDPGCVTLTLDQAGNKSPMSCWQ